MHIRKVLKSGVGVSIIVRMTTEERLLTRCFRGTDLRLAGNFSAWNSVFWFWKDQLVLDQFLREVEDLWATRDFDTHSVNINHNVFVGWESTSPIERYNTDDLESFRLNRRAQGLRVKTDRADLLAPRTKEITIVFEFRSENDRPVAIIHSIYPGRDVGDLDGDITEREGRVFFDWNHSGEI